MAITVERFHPSRTTVFRESFSIRDDSAKSWLEFGGDISAIRHPTGNLSRSLDVRAGPAEPVRWVRLPLDDASDLANRLHKLGVVGGGATLLKVDAGTDCELDVRPLSSGGAPPSDGGGGLTIESRHA